MIQLLLICALIFFTLLWYFDSFDAQILLDFMFYLLKAAGGLIGQLGQYSFDLNYIGQVATRFVIFSCFSKSIAIDSTKLQCYVSNTIAGFQPNLSTVISLLEFYRKFK